MGTSQSCPNYRGKAHHGLNQGGTSASPGPHYLGVGARTWLQASLSSASQQHPVSQSSKPAPPYTGRRCESCEDGFFGDPLGVSGAPQPCRRCRCNGNVDLNAVGNCDPHSGHCLRCLYNTTGVHCEHCLDGFYGSALAPRPEDKCAREYAIPRPRSKAWEPLSSSLTQGPHRMTE